MPDGNPPPDPGGILGPVREPEVIAHRGGAGCRPENTATAFTYAHRLGARLETDVRRSADGVAVCLHDDTFARFDGDRTKVADLPLAALRRRCAGIGLPLVTVEELLGDLPGARVVLDVKDPAVVPALARALLRTGATGRAVATGCFDPALHALRRAVGPGLELGLGWWTLAALTAGGPAGLSGSPWIASWPWISRCDWAFLPARLASGRLLARAHRAGLRTAVWTVDEPAAAQRFVALGADAVTTDRPDRLLPVLCPGRTATVRREVDACAS